MRNLLSLIRDNRLRDTVPLRELNYAIIGVATFGGLLTIALTDQEQRIFFWCMTIVIGISGLVYGLRSNWRSTAPGRALMYEHVAMFCLLVWFNIAPWLSAPPGVKTTVRDLFLLGITIAFLNTALTIFRIQEEVRRRG